MIVETDGGGCEPGMAVVSTDAGSTAVFVFCICSKRNGKSGCVLCGSTSRGDLAGDGGVDEGIAANTERSSLLNSATV